VLAHRASAARQFTQRDLGRFIAAAAILIVSMSAILALTVLPGPAPIQQGDIAAEDIRSPRSTSIESTILTEQARMAAADAVEPQYDYTPEKANAVAAQQVAAFNRLVGPVDSAFEMDVTDEARLSFLAAALPGLSEPARTTLTGLTTDRWLAVRAESERVIETTERAELRDADLALVKGSIGDRVAGDLSAEEAVLATELITPLIVPNSSYSESLTEAAREQAAAGIDPVMVDVRRGQVIVRAGDEVTPVQYELIDALGLTAGEADYAPLGGWVVLSGLLVGLLLGWVWRFRPNMWHRNNVLLLVGFLLLFTVFAYVVTAGRSIVPFFVPSAAVGMLVAILLDASLATVLTALIALIAGAVNGGSLELAAYAFLGGLAGIIAIRRGDRLQTFVQAGVIVFLVGAAVVSTFALLGEHDATGTLQLIGAAAAAAVGSAVAALGSFAVLGNVFGILTAFQLLELGNPSQPLLRRLLMETPGTYHHSLMVGNLAERAAEAIGADPLLARVAAYYHDIGKLANPLAFIENQAGGENIHDSLDPERSAMVLKQHVADGIDLAYRSKLPKTLIAFIPQHHGTAVMGYFYSRAREAAAEPHGGLETEAGRKAADAVSKARFRHAGPKPQSREAAIIMLADGVEASVRSLSARDEATIRAMVSRIIAERVDDGQLDECDVTLRDLERIREAFVAQLLGMYHERIEYPQNKVVEIESRRSRSAGA
jgi:putative nucleotidyltransferase with HDIG domain